MAPLIARRRTSSLAVGSLGVILALALFRATDRSFVGTPNSGAPLGARAAYIAADVPDHKILEGANATKLMLAAYNGQVQQMRSLLDSGADVNAQDDYGWTAFRYAIRGKQPQAALLLKLNYSADIDLPSNSGRTPLMSACGNNMEEMVRGLVNLGADLDAVDKNGLRASDHAKMQLIKDMVDPAKELRDHIMTKTDLKAGVAEVRKVPDDEVTADEAKAAGTTAPVAKASDSDVSEGSVLVKKGEKWRFLLPKTKARDASTAKKKSLWQRIRGLFRKSS